MVLSKELEELLFFLHKKQILFSGASLVNPFSKKESFRKKNREIGAKEAKESVLNRASVSSRLYFLQSSNECIEVPLGP
jgi:hypothetical protein